MDPGEERREGKTAVTGECVAHATAGSHDGSCGEKHADQREAR